MLGFITLPSIDQLIGTTTCLGGAECDFATTSAMGAIGGATGIFEGLISPALAIAGIVIGVLLVRLFVIKGLVKGTKRLTGRR